MSISVFKKGQQEQLDVQEVFNIWNLIRARHYSAELVKFYTNFVHDREFALVLSTLLSHYEKQAAILEKEGKKFKIKVPERPPYDLNITVRIAAITDKFIFRSVYNGLVAQLFSLVTAYRTSTTNDGLRKIIAEDLQQHLQDFEVLYKYGKLKGWQSDPPAYKTAKPVANEPLSATEAFHIWDNLSHRYDQLQLTQFFLEFAHDKEFRAILSQGVKSLTKQISVLEEVAVKYEVALPDRPPASASVALDPESIQDKFMYALILKGMQDAIDLHVRAVIETIRNDSLRNLLMDFFQKEMQMHELVLKYGKVKGWTKIPPIHNEPS